MISATYLYYPRMSRVDLTADYFNYKEETQPNRLYSQFLKGNYVFKTDENAREARRSATGNIKGDTVQTAYFGSKGSNNPSFLRVYDKKAEQEEKMGSNFLLAKSVESWTRFEAVYRGEYAHHITDDLIDAVRTNEDYASYIATKILEKFTFWDKKTDTISSFSEDLADCITSPCGTLFDPKNTRDNSLRQSIAYIMNGSGLFSTMYKIGAVWKKGDVKVFLDILLDKFETEYVPLAESKRELKRWIMRHGDELKNQTLQEQFKMPVLAGNIAKGGDEDGNDDAKQ